jgi:hypothetical protein
MGQAMTAPKGDWRIDVGYAALWVLIAVAAALTIAAIA